MTGTRKRDVRRRGNFEVRRWAAVVATIVAVSAVPTSFAADPDPTTPAAPKTDELTAERVEARMKEAEASKDVDEETRKKILESYRAALAELKRATESEASAAQFDKLATDAPKRADELRADLDVLVAQDGHRIDESKPLAELEVDLAQRQKDLADRKTELLTLEAQPARRAARRKEIRSILFSAPERLAEVRRQLAAAVPPDTPPPLAQARVAELRARERAIDKEAPALQNELAFYDAEEALDLPRLRRERLTRQAARDDAAVQALTAVVGNKRRQAADEAVRQAEEALAANPLLAAEAQRNKELAEETHGLASKMEQAQAEAQQSRESLEALRRQFVQTRQRVEEIGPTGPIGLLLRKQRAAFDEYGDLRREIDDRREAIETAHLKLFDYDDAWSELANPDPLVAQIVSRADPSLSPEDRKSLERSARDLVERRRTLLGTLSKDYARYFDQLVDLDATQQQIVRLADENAQYIDERVLWIRSHLPIGAAESQRSLSALLRTARPERWTALLAALVRDVRADPIPAVCGLLLFFALFHLRRRFRLELQELGETARRGNCREIGPTLRATALTFVISIPWPGILWYLSWRLSTVTDGDDEIARATARALGDAAVVLLPLELVRQILRSGGLALDHFGGAEHHVTELRRRMRRLLLTFLPLAAAWGFLHGIDGEQGNAVVERMVFAAMALVLSVFLFRVLRPKGPLVPEPPGPVAADGPTRLRHVWRWVAVSIPLVLAVQAAAGYYYTARMLGQRLLVTLLVVLGLLFLRALLRRWVLVNRRAIHIERIRLRREAAQRETAEAEEAGAIPAEMPEPDLAASTEQIHRLIDAGLVAGLIAAAWLTWVDVLPALAVLDRWSLWETTVVRTEPVAGDDANAPKSVRSVERVEPVSVADLLIALAVGILTVAAARNVPGLLDLFVLRRLALDAPLRYASTTIARYVIVLVGAVVGFGQIGLGWSKIQWIATALTFGLAFGLQEIFANFVAGLIILFERPIRVGDVVTVDGVSGVVTRLQIRATTIVNWDRQEYIVPNKEFITGRVLNWTLTDSTNRIVVAVGVAYGSDVDRTRALLLEIAAAHPCVLDMPVPLATFESFGDSTLNFVLRVFLARIDDRLRVIHDLHTAIHRRFADEGLEIAFPQRDIHIRSAAGFVPPPAANGAAPSASPAAGEAPGATGDASASSGP